MPVRPDKRNIRTDVEPLRPYTQANNTSRGSATSTDLTTPSYLCLGNFEQLDNERKVVIGDGLNAADGGAGSTYTVTIDASDFAGTGLEDDGSENLRIAAAAAGDGIQGGGGSALAIDVSDFAGSGLEDDGSENLRIATSAAGNGLTGGGGSALAVGAGDGIDVAADTVSVDVGDLIGKGLNEDANNNLVLPTPGTLTVSTTNTTTAPHTHAITSSSNPGAAAAILASSANGYLQLVRLGAGISPAVPLHTMSTGEALRVGYDASNYASFTVSSGGNLTVAPTGDFIFNPTGNDILPTTNYDLNLGAINKKYLTLHAAELWVETLVAQDTLATIGGRVLVGPTTELIAAVATSDTTIDVKHNNLANGDRTIMEANGKVEWMAIASAPTAISGGHRYTVTRNLDGTGKNEWDAGDAVFNTGTINDGFIDLYSLRGVRAHEYDDETGATGWFPTYFGHDLSSASAFFRCDGVDISGFAGTEGSDTPYTLHLHDSAGRTAMGYIGAADAAITWAAELLSNTGFETAGDGGADIWANWVESTANGGALADETTTVHADSHAMKTTTAGAGQNAGVAQTVSVTAGRLYRVAFWTYGDGTNATRYYVYDNTNGAYIIAVGSTGVSAEAWTQVVKYVVAPSGCSSMSVGLYGSTAASAVGYFDDVSIRQVTHAGGDAVHVVSARNGSTRSWASIESNFNYNDTSYTFEVRGGGGGQFGPTIVGTVRTSSTFNGLVECWAIGNMNGLYGYGTDTYGAGFGKYSEANYLTIDPTNGVRFFDSADTVQAQLSSAVWTLGSTAAEHTQIDTSGVSLKDSTTVYGRFAAITTIGQTSGGEYVSIDSTDGVRLYGGGVLHTQLKNDGTFWTGATVTTERLQWDSTNGLMIYDHNNVAVMEFEPDGDALITGTLKMEGTGSAITIGATVPTSSTTGTGIWIDRTGIFGLNSNTQEFYWDATDGTGYAGGGYVVLDANGITIAVPTPWADTRAYRLIDGSSNLLGGVYGDGNTGTEHTVALRSLDVAGEGSNTQLLAITDSDTATVTAQAVRGLGGPAVYLYAGADGEYIQLDGDVRILHPLYINDTANADQTIGLTINQGANDNQILSFKSSDIAHGITTYAETDTYGAFQKYEANGGGLLVRGFCDSDSILKAGIILHSFLGLAPDTTKSTSGLGMLTVACGKKSGTTVAACGTDANLVIFRDLATTRFIFDAEGSAHADVEWVAFDEYDDVSLLDDVEESMLAWQNPVKASFCEFLNERRNELESLGIVKFDAGNPGHAMVNFTKLSMLLVGAIRQIGGRIEDLESRLALIGPKSQGLLL